MIALDGFIAVVAIFLVGLVLTVAIRMFTAPQRETNRASQETARADRAEKVIHDVLVYARAQADVEPVARVVVDTIEQAGFTIR